MRTLTLIAAAPLVLLASCGRTTPADQATVEPMDADMAKLDMASDALPEVPANALEEVDFPGTYTRMGAAGIERITLNADNSYSYTAPSGTVTNGTYSRMNDNRRIAIEDLAGQPAYFAVAAGSIFRLDSAETPADRITVTGEYRRDPDAAATTGDTARTPSRTGAQDQATGGPATIDTAPGPGPAEAQSATTIPPARD